MEDQTPEQIAQHYSAMLNSVSVINDAIANPEKYAQDETVIQRNVEHLQHMKTRDFWTDEDMSAVDAAISAGEAV